MPDIFTDYLTVALGCSGALLFAVWLAVGVWTFRDARSRSRSAAIAVLSTLLVLLVPVAGVVIYLLLRPRQTLTEAYDLALEQEALLQQIEQPLSCPGCARRVKDTWIVCPDCRTELRRKCPNCAQPLDLRWAICPFCTMELAVPSAPTSDSVSIFTDLDDASRVNMDPDLS